jgi:hypothetical protein
MDNRARPPRVIKTHLDLRIQYMPGETVEVCLPHRAGGWFNPGGWEWVWKRAEILKVNKRSLIVRVEGSEKETIIKNDRLRARHEPPF